MAHLYGQQSATAGVAARQHGRRVVEACKELLDAPPGMLAKSAKTLSGLMGKEIDPADVRQVADAVLHEAGILKAEAARLEQLAASMAVQSLASAYAARAHELRKRDEAIANLPADEPLTKGSAERVGLLAKADQAAQHGFTSLAAGYRQRASEL